MQKPSSNPLADQMAWKAELEKIRLRNLRRQEQVGAPVRPRPVLRPDEKNSVAAELALGLDPGLASAQTDDTAEQNWSRQLEQSRLRGAMAFGGLNLPGPGATAAEDKSAAPQKAPSSAETAKMAAQVASGVGLTKLAADEAKDALKAAGKGVLAAAGALGAIANKYGIWILFYGFFSVIFVEPFITAPTILLVLWAWLVAAHLLGAKKLRKFNALELMTLFTCSSIYIAALALIVLIISLIACASDTSCVVEAIRELGVGAADIL